MSSLLRPWFVFVALLVLALPVLALPAGPLQAAPEDAFPPPVVVVYPITPTGNTAAQAGDEIALLLSARLAALGGVVVKAYTPGTERHQYLTAALAQGADYYVTGYLTPVGAEVSFVAQVVSTHSGSIVYSDTALARTFGDAATQAEPLHDAILRHAGRALASLQAAPPAPSPSAASIAGDQGVDITKAFQRHRKRERASPRPALSPAASGAASSRVASATAAPARRKVALASPSPPLSVFATPTAPPARATATVQAAGASGLIVETAGDGDATERDAAAAALARALSRLGGTPGRLPVSVTDVTQHAGDLCRANPSARTFYAGRLVVGHDAQGVANVAYDVSAYDCKAALVTSGHAVSDVGRGGVTAAIDRVVDSAVAVLRRAAVTPAGRRAAR